MNFPNLVRKNTSRLRLITLICILGVYGSPNAQASQQPTPDSQTQTQTQTQKFDQKKIVRAIYDATKTAKTAKELTAFLEQCDEALVRELSTANRSYVISLRGWGLNRRGEKHFEMAAQLKRIGNLQYETAMKQAIEDFDAAIIAAPERYRSWLSRGIAHVADDNYDRAILDFTEVTKLKADESSGWFNRAEAFYHRGNFLPAIGDYEVVLRLDSDDAQALTGRGLSLLSLEKHEAAIVDFDRVIELCPDTNAAYLNRGDAYEELHKWELADSDYQRAMAIKETGAACQRLAWLKATCPDVNVTDADMAKQMIVRAIEINGETVTNLDTLAAVEAANGDFESAKNNQSKVIGLVGFEDNDQSNPYKARLTLYENSEPFIQSKTNPLTEDAPENGPSKQPAVNNLSEPENDK